MLAISSRASWAVSKVWNNRWSWDRCQDIGMRYFKEYRKRFPSFWINKAITVVPFELEGPGSVDPTGLPRSTSGMWLIRTFDLLFQGLGCRVRIIPCPSLNDQSKTSRFWFPKPVVKRFGIWNLVKTGSTNYKVLLTYVPVCSSIFSLSVQVRHNYVALIYCNSGIIFVFCDWTVCPSASDDLIMQR